MIVDTELIMQLLDYRTQSDIAENTGVAQPTISRIKHGIVMVENLTVGTAHLLTQYALKVLPPDAGK